MNENHPKINKEITSIVNENLKKLQDVFPSAVKDGKLDITALKEELGVFEELKKGDEKYTLNWVGKQNAVKEYQKDLTGKTLKYAKGEGVNEENTQNIYIEGDNLEVLKLLKKNYNGEIKMIYIDPPYNTGNDFVYDDDFSISKEEAEKAIGIRDEYNEKLQRNTSDEDKYHSKWLNMMYSRLKIARELLADDGVIFISIDDNEIANLRKICDEIFREENFIGIFSVENNPKGRKNSKFISVSNEYCIMYAKIYSESSFYNVVPKEASDMVQDENGDYIRNSGKRVLVGENFLNKIVTDFNSDKHYSVYYNDVSKDMKLMKEKNINEINSSLLELGYNRYITFRENRFVENTYTANKFKELFLTGCLNIKESKIYEKHFSDKIQVKSMLTNKKYKAIVNNQEVTYELDLKTTSAQKLLDTLLGEKIFQFPKNISYLKLLISLICSQDDAIILDFFSGSATTAHAVMQLNAEDGGKRKYIMVQLPENLDENLKKATSNEKQTIQNAIKFCDENGFPHSLTEIGKERIRRAGKQIKEENPDKNIDIGFKVFRVGETNLNWEHQNLQGKDLINNYKADSSDKDKLDFTPNFTDIDVVYEIMLRQEGLPLTAKIEQLTDIGNRTYYIAKSLVICLEENITNEMVEKLSKINPADKFIFRDSAFDDNIPLKNETFNRLSALIDKNSSKKNAYKVEFI